VRCYGPFRQRELESGRLGDRLGRRITIMRMIHILLANKADESFSCYPSIRTLMSESDAGRSTVLRALKDLETNGFITRQRQFRESEAQRPSRYHLNHRHALPLSSSPQAKLPRPDPKQGQRQCETGGYQNDTPRENRSETP
jgi:DNA-binding transcriptional MocR family regulator